MLITHRQRQHLSLANRCLDDAIAQLDGHVETDIIASTLRGFVLSIKDVVGEVYNEDVLNNIFKGFCRFLD